MFYPTITSMYLEVAFALGLVWLASSRLAFVALALTGAGIIATFTRAGLVTMTMSLLVYGGLLYYKGRRWEGAHTRLAALAAVLLALVMLSRSPQMLVTRMSTGVSQDWYGASYEVPGTLTLRPDSITEVPVTLSNRGRLTVAVNAVAGVCAVVSLAVDRHRRSGDFRRPEDTIHARPSSPVRK